MAGGRLGSDPDQNSLRLLPSGPDRVGEKPVRPNLPRPISAIGVRIASEKGAVRARFLDRCNAPAYSDFLLLRGAGEMTDKSTDQASTNSLPVTTTPPGLSPDKSPWREELAATFKLALPIALTQLSTIALNTTDVIMLGWLGPEPLAAASLASNLLFPAQFVGVSVLAALSPLFAQALGARQFRGVRRTARQGFWAAITLFIPFAIYLAFSHEILLLLGQHESISGDAEIYISIALWALLPNFAFIVLRNFISAHSRPRSALVVVLIGIVLNALIDYVLIFGKFGFPELGLFGAALATTLVQSLMFLMLLAYVLRDRRFRRYYILARFWRPDWPRYREIFTVGIPIGLTTLAETGLFSATGLMVGLFGVQALAGHAVALQFGAISFMIPLGISQAATVRIGLAVGAQRYQNIGPAGWSAIGIGAVVMTTAALLFWLIPETLSGLILDRGNPANTEALGYAVSFLGVAALFQYADGGQAIALGCLRGMKDTRMPLVIAVIGYWVFGMGAAVWLGFYTDLQGVGVWLGLVAGLLVVAVALTWRFQGRGRFIDPKFAP